LIETEDEDETKTVAISSPQSAGKSAV
jgi:hypothetical protein